MGFRLIIAHQHRRVREQLRRLLSENDSVVVVGDVSNTDDVVLSVRSLAPDVVLMDVSLPDVSGIEATRRVIAESPKTRVIAISGEGDVQFVSEMIRAGAKGHIGKFGIVPDLAEQVLGIVSAEHDLPMHNDETPRLSIQVKMATARLTPREREVLRLVSDGYSSKEAAAQLHVGQKTIETHRNQIMRKLQIRSVAQLTKYAIREGITSLE